MVKVSVVIPVYNTGPYLRRCLDSVCISTLPELEIICIDDASTDNSSAILREYSENDSRITLISFSCNKGAAAARNAAIAIAHGEYLSFIDSDDAIDPHFYEKLFSKALIANVNIVKGAQCVIKNGIRLERPLNDKVRQDRLAFSSQPLTAIYKTDFIRRNAINFPLGTTSEDLAFLRKAVSLVESVETVDDVYYYYFKERDGSRSKQLFNCMLMKMYLDSHQDIISFINFHHVDQKTYDRVYRETLLNCANPPFFRNIIRNESDGIARLCAETAIRLYSVCERRSALNAGIVINFPEIHEFFLKGDVSGLADWLLLPKKTAEQKKKMAAEKRAATLCARLRAARTIR